MCKVFFFFFFSELGSTGFLEPSGVLHLPGREHREGALRTMALSPFSFLLPLPTTTCLDIVSDNLLYAQRGKGGSIKGEASPALIPLQGSHVLISL